MPLTLHRHRFIVTYLTEDPDPQSVRQRLDHALDRDAHWGREVTPVDSTHHILPDQPDEDDLAWDRWEEAHVQPLLDPATKGKVTP